MSRLIINSDGICESILRIFSAERWISEQVLTIENNSSEAVCVEWQSREEGEKPKFNTVEIPPNTELDIKLVFYSSMPITLDVNDKLVNLLYEVGKSNTGSDAEIDINLAYTGEFIQNTDGIEYAVINPVKLDFECKAVKFGKKTKPTHVRAAKAGEVIVTLFNGMPENAPFTAQGGELIFTNELSTGVNSYVPRDSNNIPNGQANLDASYEFVGGNINEEGAYYRPVGKAVKILHEIIDRPTVIKDAWGPGNHQYMQAGATLKCDNGRVTSIDKEAFDETWSITDRAGVIIKFAAQGLEK